MSASPDSSLLREQLVLGYAAAASTKHREALEAAYGQKITVNPDLSRSLVSFQANKREPFYRWFKYKEGFSKAFVREILTKFGNAQAHQVVLDPFSGVGTTVTTSLELGFEGIGIELLAPGILATKARISSLQVSPGALRRCVEELEAMDWQEPNVADSYFFQHLTITAGAFPPETEQGIAHVNRYIAEQVKDKPLQLMLRFALSAVLEDVSYTRKDGQYLRWDARAAGRKIKSSFHKGTIPPLKTRLIDQLTCMVEDVSQRTPQGELPPYRLLQGSCLEQLPTLPARSVDLIITSPPYCNRYDYTRTYALELAFNGIDDQAIKVMRQTLLSATVENKSKANYLAQQYAQAGRSQAYMQMSEAFDQQMALQEVLACLRKHRPNLNNKNIPDMVHHYFFEMNLVVHELARVLKPGGRVVMVNDNVRYHGEDIPVDLILSEFARSAGLETDVIWKLARGKGNSSQQMGAHGRKELRKCVYVWQKPV